MAANMRANGTIDVRPVLPLVRCPTLILHCADDPIIPVKRGREFAALIPGAEYLEIDAAFHGSARPRDMDLYIDPIERFITGSSAATRPADRVLATVLFTDIVGSTELAADLGDRRWKELLDDHDAISARAVDRVRGRVVKTTGDGVLATFDGPASAIAAARRMIDDLDVLGVEIRAGVHTGEVERRGDDIGGVGVNLAARIMAAAPAGEIWVSSTVPGLTVGADLAFESRGRHQLKGIPDEWELHVVRPGGT
jgi:class 3 adenylate cyclase